MKRRRDNAAGELRLAMLEHIHQHGFRCRHACFDQIFLVLGVGRRGRWIEFAHISGVQILRASSKAPRAVPVPHLRSRVAVHARCLRPNAEPPAVLTGQTDGRLVIAERQHEDAVQHHVWVQPLSIDGQIFGRGGDNWLQAVGKCAALTGLRLSQLVNDKNLGFQLVAPLAGHGVVVHDAAVV